MAAEPALSDAPMQNGHVEQHAGDSNAAKRSKVDKRKEKKKKQKQNKQQRRYLA